MPIDVILQKKVSDSVWSATGSFSGLASGDKPVSGPAEILLKEVGNNELVPYLDSKLMVSKIMNKEVTLYYDSTPVSIKKIKEGAKVQLQKIRFEIFNPKK